MTEEERILDFKHQGRPSAVPKGVCGVCTKMLGVFVGFCEKDWRWEHKSHLSSQMHGNIDETKDRSEPIVYLTKKDTKWEREQV